MTRRLLTILSATMLTLSGGMTAALTMTTASAATVATPAAAAPAPTAPAPAIHRDRACVARATPAARATSAARIGTVTMTCYATFADAVSAITGGRVSLPESARPGTVTPDEINPAPGTPDTTFVLSVDYQNADFGGNTLFWTESSGCGDFAASSLPSGWNDQISSVTNSSGCATTLYQNVDFGGTTFGVKKDGSAASLGSFNDEASSQAWCPGLPC
ncbi:MAG TPA: peptidase inhibitor family I36 protein [Streptosporangiaceae bacterium]|nr:peptidase inhibitor family I36 protein [Streptosporangiaceae bacterium]